MTKLQTFAKSTWTVEEVIELSKGDTAPTSGETTNFSIYFLNGVFKEKPSNIGFHISGTKIMAIFKDVIKSTSTKSDPMVPKYVEQATLVHEMGHALGLVNNGVPMFTPHQDTAHGAHCNKPDCVMYYSNEGTASMIRFVLSAKDKLSLVMFDQECLNDAQNFKK
jgi:hypothetical protein